ncbi:hypothetical protein GYMLUDRAFT_251646 [Collybiopsis luxurians FD-317 M1]|uniref:Uncharacterized protein n=1 Tax=Collybiopsis luxurians FD-317 M1 TaxID=944289 RepID=A0A0D0BBX5_9AGAR|nr:hypothetical protein GYMLUDRAFT_251646 [Collybiopsis luxurians FD-317 M1]
MSSNNSSFLPNLLVFPEDCQLIGLSNWAIFRDHLKSVAQSTGLGGYLDGTITAPPVVIGPPAAGAPIVPTATPINSCNPSVEEWELQWMTSQNHLPEYQGSLFHWCLPGYDLQCNVGSTYL